MHAPDTSLVALEAELTALLPEIARLQARWPTDPSAVARARIGRELEDAYERLAGIYAAIVRTQPETLADAAVLLRRVAAVLEGDKRPDVQDIAIARRMMDAALGVVEKATA